MLNGKGTTVLSCPYMASYMMASMGMPMCVLGLMYGFMRLYAIRYLGFVDDDVKGPNLSFSFSFSRIPLSGVSSIIS